MSTVSLALKKKSDKQVLNHPIKSKSFSLNWVSGWIALSEMLLLSGAGATICLSYLGWVSAGSWSYFLAIIAPSLGVTFAFYHAGLYEIGSISNPLGQIHKILGILIVTFLSFLALAFALKVSSQFSRVWVLTWFLSSVLLIFLEREFWRFICGRWARTGQLSRKIIVVGTGEQARKYIEQLQQTKEPWLNIVGIFDDRKERTDSSFMGYPVLGSLDDLLDYARENHIDDIIVSLPWSAEHRIGAISRKLAELPVHIRLGSDLAGFLSLNPGYSFIGSIPMINLANKPLDGWRYAVKQLEDKFISLLLLIMFSPLMLIIALAVKLESEGPVFFRQSRKGFNGKKFSVFKFRSMYHNRSPDIGSAQAKKKDSRVTTIGRLLRRSSLDELPQLLNVLCGNMSLVGPRPHPQALDDEFCEIIGGYLARHRVKPGITGWAQVNGFRGETDTPDKMQSRVEHDTHYIENWSLIFDIRILVMTVLVVAFQKNAY